MKNNWNEHNGDIMKLPYWRDTDVLEVEYRDGRRATGTDPCTFSGWDHINSSGDWPNDIVRWRHAK